MLRALRAPRRFINHRNYRAEVEERSINKVLVANRGDIAIRIFRACTELDIKTVAIHSSEDKGMSHKLKADESYLIGVGQDPINAYLNINEIMKVCMHSEVDAVHPGHGFLSEKPDFARRVIKAGIKFIGPPPNVMDQLADKVKAKAIAERLQIPVLPSTGSIRNLDDAQTFVKRVGIPVVVKPTYGKEGKGIHLVENMGKLNDTIHLAVIQAIQAVGNGSVYLEKFLPNAKHIEVQIVADLLGNVVHLFDRECSIQRKYSKICAIAPVPNLSPETRETLTKAALEMARHIQYEDVGSFEFLVDSSGNYYFLEANAALAVEHAVTEEITGIDLVQTQLKMAEGQSLKNYFNITQEKIIPYCYAIQCSISAEDPKQNFHPDSGRIDVLRLGAGPGIRIDGNHAFAGAHVSSQYESDLIRLTAHAKTFKATARRMARTLKEFSIRGVKTNMSFLMNLLEHKHFQKGNITTSFLQDHPSLFEYRNARNRAYLLLLYMGDILVNGPSTQFYTEHKPHNITPVIPKVRNDPFPHGFRTLLKTKGPIEFIKAVKAKNEVLITDTTFRDAHQSLLVTRVRTYDLLNIAPFVAQNFHNLFSIEMWGGATFDVALRYLHECPWQRLIELRELIPNIPFQMLLRGTSTVGYFNYPDNVVYKFCEMAARAGIDIFRIFDALNYLPNLKLGMDAVRKAGGIVEAAITYTGDVGDTKRTKYNLQYYLDLAAQLVNNGTQILGIKDTCSLLKPRAAKLLVTALKNKFPDVPIHIHTHDTSGNGVATLLSAASAGADILDVAVDTMSGITSQPSMGAVVSAIKETDRDTKICQDSISTYAAYWEQTRTLYAPFECTSTMKSGNSDVYKYEIPGPQYISLQFQAYSYGSGDYFEDIKKAYAEANMLLGDVVKAMPSCMVVGDLAHFMVQNKLSVDDIVDKAEDLVFPASVVSFLLGAMGEPYRGYPEPLRSIVTKGMRPFEGRPGVSLLSLDFEELEQNLKRSYNNINEYDVMSAAIFPYSAREFFEFRSKFGPVDKLPPRIFLVGPQVGEEFFIVLEKGKTAELKILAVSNHHTSDGERQVFYELNGTLRVAYVVDKKAGRKVVINPKADKGNRSHIGAPLCGVVSKINVKPGDVVEKRHPLAVLYAMKMETTIFCPFSGIIKDVHVSVGAELEIGDLIMTVE